MLLDAIHQARKMPIPPHTVAEYVRDDKVELIDLLSLHIQSIHSNYLKATGFSLQPRILCHIRSTAV